MYIGSELAIVLIEIVIIHIYLQGMFPKKNFHSRVWLFAYLCFGIGDALLSFIPNASFLRIAFFGLGIIILASVLFQTRLSQAFFSSFLFCAICVLTDVLMYLFLPIFQLESQQLLEVGLPRLIWSITSHVMTLILVLFLVMIVNRGHSVITLPFILMLTPGCVISIVLGCYFCQIVQANSKLLPFPFLFASLGLLYMNILVVFYAEQVKQTADKKMELELAEQHYIMQEQYYEQLRSEQNETRAMFHEINKYMRAMQALVADKDLQQATQSLQHAETLFSELGQVTDVGNSVVSIILNEYRQRMLDEEIEFTFDVSVPAVLGITAVDVYILLGNALDNAINACYGLPVAERYVHLQLKLFHDVLFFQVRNPFPEGYQSRSIKKGHGYGLKSIKKCVEKYDGVVNTSSNSHIFEISVRLNISGNPTLS